MNVSNVGKGIGFYIGDFSAVTWLTRVQRPEIFFSCNQGMLSMRWPPKNRLGDHLMLIVPRSMLQENSMRSTQGGRVAR